VAAKLAAFQEGLSSMSEFVWLWNLVFLSEERPTLNMIEKIWRENYLDPRSRKLQKNEEICVL
jgi:hypothetical protein